MKRIRLNEAIAVLFVLLVAGPVAAEIIVDVPAEPPAPVSGQPAITQPPTAAGGEPASGGNTAGNDVLSLINGDKLHGSLVGVTEGEHGLQWKHVSAAKPMDFAVPSIAGMTLASRKPAKEQAYKAMAYLTNGDMLPGNIVSLDSDNVTLDTWYSGKVQIKRAMLKALNPNSSVTSALYTGPGELSDWIQPNRYGRGQQGWECKNGILYALMSYPIGRYIEDLSNKADFQFEAAWRASSPSFSFTFFTDNLQESGNGYNLQFSGSSVYLQRYSRESGSRSIGGSESLELLNNRGGRVTKFNILADKETRTIALLIDGSVVKQWTDPTPTSVSGSGISFRPHSTGDLRIGNIRVSQWDGKIPQVVGDPGETKEDTVRFVNNDKVSGKLKTIEAGTLKFETSYATLDIPIERAVEVTFASEKAERARRNKEDVRGHFSDKGTITLKLSRIDQDMVKGQSENFGEIAVPLSTFRLLEFNIYKERKAEEDDFMR